MIIILFFVTSFILQTRFVSGGLEPPAKEAILHNLYGKPCECRGGKSESPVVPKRYTYTQDCGETTAYLVQNYGAMGGSQSWNRVPKPKSLPPSSRCPCSTYQDSMHSACYTAV